MGFPGTFLEVCLRQNDQEVWDIHYDDLRLGDHGPPVKYCCFTRQGHVHASDMYHGCVLSQAHSILKEGFRVGEGTHCHNGRSCTGLFGFTGDPLQSARRQIHCSVLGLASERANMERCTEILLGDRICGWGVPVVLRISQPEPIVRLKMVGSCFKSVWEEKMGSLILQLGEISVYVPVDRLRRFNELAKEPALSLKQLVSCADLGDRMLCCGKWTDVQYGQKHGRATCGRIMDYNSLDTNGWKKSRSSGMWYCPECYTWMTVR